MSLAKFMDALFTQQGELWRRLLWSDLPICIIPLMTCFGQGAQSQKWVPISFFPVVILPYMPYKYGGFNGRMEENPGLPLEEQSSKPGINLKTLVE